MRESLMYGREVTRVPTSTQKPRPSPLTSAANAEPPR